MQYAIISYYNREGILKLGYNKLKLAINPITILNNATACHTFLTKLVEQHQLCAFHCQIATNKNHCKTCIDGKCISLTTAQNINAYNKKVEKLITNYIVSKTNLILKEQGRDTKETAFVQIKEGVYQGYGFISNEEPLKNEQDLEAFLIKQKHTPEVDRILAPYLR